ncbi:cytochrome P450 6k1-like isoform X2 [Harpegnathos saltator]|uniref:cytochrome P450 6k1-like isoform X2 n=1 Tax=Harpegnathos saltator TaxID=610380 RepID=UPI000DBECFAA|nr:cytochrome P450 6k1-like isoform X2 [Harpegnathos saltator]
MIGTNIVITTNNWILNGIMAVIMLMIITVVVAYLFMTRKFNYWKKRGVYEVKPVAFFGNMTNCILGKRSPSFIFKDLYDKTKGLPHMGLYIFDKPCLLLRDREIVKDVLIRDFDYFCDRTMMCSPTDRLGRSTLPLLKEPTWKIVRGKLTRVFTSHKLKKMFDFMMECSVDLDSYLDSLGLDGKGKIVDVKDLFINLTTDIISNTAFGVKINSFRNPNNEFRIKGKKTTDFTLKRGLELIMVFFYPEITRLFNIKLFGAGCNRFFRKFFWDMVEQRTQSGKKRGDLVDILIKLKEEFADQDFNDFKFDGDDLVAQAAIFISGSLETSSTTMSFALYEIAIHPEVQNKLRKEILDAVREAGGKITYEMVTISLPYLDMVLSETMRMYPVVSVLDREVVKSYKIPNSDLVIEKGMSVYISLLGMHYDPEYFPNPEEFDPERFSPDNIHKIPSCAYMPFGEGPRKCIDEIGNYKNVISI